MMVTGEPREVPVEGMEDALVLSTGPMPCVQGITASETSSRTDTPLPELSFLR